MVLPPPPASLFADASLFLDLDGTLVDFAPLPGDIVVGRDLQDILRDLHDRLGGRLAVVSGRALHDLGHHLEIDHLPAAGSHGLERRHASGETHRPEATKALSDAFAEITETATFEGLHFENKPLSLAVHYRQRPDLADQIIPQIESIARRHGLLVQKGAMVVEVRPKGPNKGDAVRAFMSEPPFKFGRPVFVGDDLTDEAAFRAARELGGHAVLVGEMRETEAQFRLPDVAAVRAWLKGAL
ncbi:MAG TPA: trehalose-phosphatase [Sphingomicrobium sp.]